MLKRLHPTLIQSSVKLTIFLLSIALIQNYSRIIFQEPDQEYSSGYDYDIDPR